MAGVTHALVLQVTSQLHEEAQDTPPRQLAAPVQVTRQAPEPHVTPSSHVPLPLHSTVQLVASEQSTLSQSSLSRHRTVQAMPAGHSIVS